MTDKNAYQKNIRNRNLKVVTDTISTIRSIHGNDYIFSAAELSNLTGISRQTLSQAFYRKLWDSEYIRKTNTQSEFINEGDLLTKLAQLEKTNARLSVQNKDLINLKRSYYAELQSLKKAYKHLLFFNLSLLRRMRLYGLDTDDLMKNLDSFKTIKLEVDKNSSNDSHKDK